MAPFATFSPHQNLGDSPPGTQSIGAWGGYADGTYYNHVNTVETDAYAAYTQGTYSFNEQWALTLGVRWAKDEKEALESRTGITEIDINDPDAFLNQAPFFASAVFEGQCTGAVAAGGWGLPSCAAVGLTPLAMMNIFMGSALPTFNPAAPIVPTCALDDPDCATPLRLAGLPFSFADNTSGKDSWDAVTWRANLDWTPNDDTLVYLSATTGYRAGGYSLGVLNARVVDGGVVSEPFSYEEEEVIAYELGYKGTFLDSRLQVNSSVYLYQYDDYQDQIDLFNPVTGGSVDVVENVDEAENMGVEVEVTWLPTDSWTIGGNGSYTDTEYKSDFFVVEDDNPEFPAPLFEDLNGDDAFLVRNLKGNSLKRIPEWKFTAWSTYDWNFNAGVLTAGASWAYTGSYFDSGIERSLDKVPQRDRLDLFVGWRDSRDRWDVRAFVDNVFDDIGPREIGTGTATSNWALTGTTLYPRFYGLDVTYRMGG
jgi:outer membrane receptor protein involved in Fe transport